MTPIIQISEGVNCSVQSAYMTKNSANVLLPKSPKKCLHSLCVQKCGGGGGHANRVAHQLVTCLSLVYTPPPSNL